MKWWLRWLDSLQKERRRHCKVLGGRRRDLKMISQSYVFKLNGIEEVDIKSPNLVDAKLSDSGSTMIPSIRAHGDFLGKSIT